MAKFTVKDLKKALENLDESKEVPQLVRTGNAMIFTDKLMRAGYSIENI